MANIRPGGGSGTGGLTLTNTPSFPLGSIAQTIDVRTVPGGAPYGTANHAKGVRVIMPKAGTLKGFSFWVVTQSGNCEGMVLDTTATTRNVLWSSGSVAVGTGTAWQTIGDPNIVVTAGQQVDFALTLDNTTASIGRAASISGFHTIPSAFTIQAAGGGKNQLVWDAAQTIPVGGTVAESGFGGTSIVPAIIAYIV